MESRDMQCDVSAFYAKHELYVNDNAEVRVLTVC